MKQPKIGVELVPVPACRGSLQEACRGTVLAAPISYEMLFLSLSEEHGPETGAELLAKQAAACFHEFFRPFLL